MDRGDAGTSIGQIATRERRKDFDPPFEIEGQFSLPSIAVHKYENKVTKMN